MSPITPAAALPAADPVDAEPRRVPDVPGALARVHRQGEFISVRADATVMDAELYTTVPENNDGTNNHFQGLQRLADGRHFVISGGNWRPEPRGSEIYVGRIGSMGADGPWLSNLTERGAIPEADTLIGAVTVDARLWHAGGMDLCGPVLAIAVEHNGGIGSILTGSGRGGRADESAICFFDMSDPTSPRLFAGPDQRIHRPGFKAGAVALTRLSSGHYLCGAWSDSDAGPMRLDLYLSIGAGPFDGRFLQGPDVVRTWTPDPGDPARRALEFQAVNFVRDADGLIYLLGFGVDGGTHAVEVYGVHIPGVHTAATGDAGIMDPIIERLGTSRATFHCQTSQCDMRGASGAYVDRGELILYSGAQYRGDRAGKPVRFAEFRGALAPVEDVTAETAWVELYRRAQYGGARLSLRNLAATPPIANYKDVRVSGRHFGDLATSARYQLPVGLDYVLYEHDGFRKPILRLRGTGEVEVEPDFTVLGEKVSSSRLEPTP